LIKVKSFFQARISVREAEGHLINILFVFKGEGDAENEPQSMVRTTIVKYVLHWNTMPDSKNNDKKREECVY